LNAHQRRVQRRRHARGELAACPPTSMRGGYGFAFGGGIGGYNFCTCCGWYTKHRDPELYPEDAGGAS
jgi:hypothetical protein